MTLRVWVTPGAPRSVLGGVADGRLRVRLAAPAHEGKANAELLRFLAMTLGVPRDAVHITHGASARRKAVRVDGIAYDVARQKLHL